MLNSHLIGFLALAKERVRLLPFGWHPGTQLLGTHLNSYKKRRNMRESPIRSLKPCWPGQCRNFTGWLVTVQ
ncbi:MAG: hypothetical protein KZQ66_19240 [Candidatus Thiodiazotropha sp. (ex Lucinoma aequizonata)]|nr:hypothetical protein [Candidatus Thiodiazotropha sp. (ex Lucinoma aequizonata)]MCU7903847.1 hypothetical protein [Candidatus Thiodiazotropha sp. (ex Lucinoma aequizonata)]